MYSNPEDVWDWLPEHHFYIFRTLRSNKNSVRKFYIATGIGILNAHKSYTIKTSPTNIFKLNMQFSAIEAKIGIPFGKHFWGEFVTNLIPKTYPAERGSNNYLLSRTDKNPHNHLFFSAKMLYNFHRQSFQ